LVTLFRQKLEISMNKLFRTKPLVILFLMTMLLLAACSSAAQSPTAEATANQAAASETEPQSTEAQLAEAEPTQTETAKSGGQVSAVGTQMECTLVSDQPEVPAELEAIFGVTEEDWVVGPEGAAVTFVEYSDFQ
jgi:preprotein translocase subunit SecG